MAVGLSVAANLKWLQENPQFDEVPATIEEFLEDGYLEIGKGIRPGVKSALKDIFGDKVNPQRIAIVEDFIFTGGIGCGKSTLAAIAIPYMVHSTLCLKDPQDFYELLPGSRIAFVMMSTSEKQAREVIFSDIKARIDKSPWFRTRYPYNPKLIRQIRFPTKDIWIIPGGSVETTFEGYNVLGGVIDELDSHKQTAEKDFADLGYDSIRSRISSRFVDPESEGHRGLLICIGQMKSSQGFASRKYEEFQKSKTAKAVRMTIWDSLGWAKFSKPGGGRGQGSRNSFWYDMKRHKIVPSEVAQWVQSRENLIEVPEAYRQNFVNNPVKALRDLAGIPPATTDPFITMLDRVDEARDKWIARTGFDSPVLPDPGWPKLISGFKAPDSRKRAMHLDLATSGDGDALGIAMGYVDGLIEEEGELKPYIIFDLLARIKAVPGEEIILADVRRFIYYLRDDLGFKILDITIDGFQSTDTMQILRKKKFRVDYLSVDRSTGPYETLRESIYDRRIEFPKFMTYLSRSNNNLVEIAYKELMELNYNGKKVDHPAKGSKDLTDCMAGVAEKLTGDRSYRRGATRPSGMPLPDMGGASSKEQGEDSSSPVEFNFPSKQAVNLGALDSLSSLIPPHLRQKGSRR
jgi:hypothetical protein